MYQYLTTGERCIIRAYRKLKIDVSGMGRKMRGDGWTRKMPVYVEDRLTLFALTWLKSHLRHLKPLIRREDNSSFESEKYNFPVTSTTTSIASPTRQKLLTRCEVNCSASPLKISTRFTSIHLYTFGE